MISSESAKPHCPGRVQADQAGRRKRLEADLATARAAAVAARETAAKLQGQAKELTTQYAQLMRVIEGRDGTGRPAPRGGHK